MQETLTHAETEVLRLIACGLTRQQAAARLSVTPETIQTHERFLFRKIGVRNRTQAALYALHTRLVSLEEAWRTVVEQQGLTA